MPAPIKTQTNAPVGTPAQLSVTRCLLLLNWALSCPWHIEQLACSHRHVPTTIWPQSHRSRRSRRSRRTSDHSYLIMTRQPLTALQPPDIFVTAHICRFATARWPRDLCLTLTWHLTTASPNISTV